MSERVKKIINFIPRPIRQLTLAALVAGKVLGYGYFGFFRDAPNLVPFPYLDFDRDAKSGEVSMYAGMNINNGLQSLSVPNIIFADNHVLAGYIYSRGNHLHNVGGIGCSLKTIRCDIINTVLATEYKPPFFDKK